MITNMQLLLKSSKNILFNVLSGFLILWGAFTIGMTEWDPKSSPPFMGPFDSHATPMSSVSPKAPLMVWDSLSAELNLDHKAQSTQVKAEIRKLLAEPNKFNSILKAATPYIYYIHKETQARGLPAELALIPIIESEFNPNDHSTKGATGLWQLMPGTATELGIKVQSGYDGRRNVIASTKGALAYFNDLGNSFKGNWYLAIAAYNCGQMRVIHAERRGKSQNFWDLSLPKETKYYVPKLLAVAEIIKNPQKYGVQLPAMQNQPFFTEVKVKHSVSLVSLAKTSGIDVNVLHTLNPDYNHGSVPNKHGFSVLVPANKAPVVMAHLSSVTL